MMEWIHYVSYFFGSTFLTNAVPHFVSGIDGAVPFKAHLQSHPAWDFLLRK